MKNLTLLLAAVLLFSYTYAQKAELKSGSVSALAGQTELNVIYDYEGLKIGSGKKARTEEEYIKEKVSEYNAKEPGKGDKWLEKWKSDRPNFYQPKFEDLMNKGLEKAGIKVAQNLSSAKYTLKVNATRIEPGISTYAFKIPAQVDATFTITETATGKEIAVIEILESPGQLPSAFDFDSATRISEGFEKAGKTLSGYISKNLK